MFAKYASDQIPTYNEKEAFIKVTIEPDPKIGVEYMINNQYDDTSNFIQHIYKTKYDSASQTTPPSNNPIKTRVDIVGEKINLFTYPNNRDTAYGIPYAELFVEYLFNLQNWDSSNYCIAYCNDDCYLSSSKGVCTINGSRYCKYVCWK
jgi:hypothetical protein